MKRARVKSSSVSIISCMRPAARRMRSSWSRTRRAAAPCAAQQQIAAIDDRAERIAQIVAEDPHHPLAKIELVGQLLLRALLLGDVGRGADDADDLAGVVAQRLDRLAEMPALLAAEREVHLLLHAPRPPRAPAASPW